MVDRWSEAGRATADVVPLLRFRGAGLRTRSRKAAAVAFGVVVVLTVLAGTVPAHLPGAAGSDGASRILASEVLLLLPSAYLSVLVISIVSAVASGGGRELVPRDQAVAFPVSATTDHLGTLLMAPLNITWLLQAWSVLGVTAFALGPERLYAVQVPVLLWLLAATALAQVVAWAAEWVRRGPHGSWVLRILTVALTGAAAALVATDRLVPLLNRSPTRHIALGALHGSRGAWALWLAVVGGLVVVGVVAVVAGAVMARVAARRPARDELRVESSLHSPRPNPAADLTALLRTDRAGIWRSVPLRRGIVVLAALPGLVGLAGGLDWERLVILPALVASGGALLFGVNSWCLDGRGGLWRDSLPVSPKLAFASRALVLAEVLLLPSLLALVLAGLRAGVPSLPQLVAVACAVVVVSVQVVGTALRWSVRRPFAADMRSARATPAPPLAMMGYSARLALTTTVTAMLFTVTAGLADWRWSLLVAVPFLLYSSGKLVLTSREWADPRARARVVATVAS